MVERLYFRDLVSFREVEIEFGKGLVVFSGPSGAGKSLLISTILSSFGHTSQATAALCELLIQKPAKLKSEEYELDDEVAIKILKKEKLRYFIDGQKISKKALLKLFAPYVQYLSVRDKSGFESERLLALIDKQLYSDDKGYKKLHKEYRKRYQTFHQKRQELERIKADEAKLAELIEFATYEIEKIEMIAPKVGEEEELLRVKQQLSRIDKIKDTMNEASEIFRLEEKVEEAYRLLDKPSGLFSEAMNQLRADFEDAESLAEELEGVDVEEVLDRLSDLTMLKNRYGSIEEALAYKEAKQKELAGYEHIEQDKSMLESFLAMELSELNILASKISAARKAEARRIEQQIVTYLEALRLPHLTFHFEKTSLDASGIDRVDVAIGGSKADTLSGGEFNRLRLALMATTIDTKRSEGILILDEIDANVSGDESIAIAEMIATLSSAYQIFAISHQPHLAAKADQHILVTKEDGESRAEVLGETKRVQEIARIIAGEHPTHQAMEFAKKLRNA